MSEGHLRIVGRAHVLDILRLLEESPKGVPYTRIHYQVVRTSSTAALLEELQNLGLISKVDSNFTATSAGVSMLRAGEQLEKLSAGVDRRGSAPVDRRRTVR